MRSKNKMGYNLMRMPSPQTIFLSISFLILIYAFYNIFTYKYDSLLKLVFDDATDSYMDFFNPVFHAYKANPYIKVDRIYPALPYTFFYWLSLVIPKNIIVQGSTAIRGSLEGLSVFMVYNAVTISLIVLMLWQYISGSNGRKILTISLFLFSAPFMFMYQRGNIIILSLIFLLGYMMWKDSDTHWKREIALIFLALAATIKIYPAIFGLLLLVQKRWMDSFKSTIYGIIAFVVPFHFMGGIDNIVKMYSNMQSLIELYTQIGYAYKVNITNTLRFLSNYNHLGLSETLFNYTSGVLLVTGIIAAIFIQKEWKRVLILSTIMAAIPNFSFSYSLIFMIIPLILFLNQYELQKGIQRIRIDYVYAILFTLIFSIFVFIDDTKIAQFAAGPYRYNITHLLEGIALIVILIIANSEGIIDMVRNIRSKIIHKRANIMK